MARRLRNVYCGARSRDDADPGDGVSEVWEIRYTLAGWALFAIWLASLVLPVTQHGPLGEQTGFYFLMFGWGGALTLQFAWLANPLLMFAILYAAKSREPRLWVGLVCGIALCLLAASAAFYHILAGPDGGTKVVPHAIGFHLWLVAVLGAAALIIVRTLTQETIES